MTYPSDLTDKQWDLIKTLVLTVNTGSKTTTYMWGDVIKKGGLSQAAAKSCEVGAKPGTANLLSRPCELNLKIGKC